MCRSISIKLCAMIQDIRASTAQKTFLDLISSLAARGHRKFGSKMPHRGKLLFIVLSFIELKQPNLAGLRTLKTRINLVHL